MVTKPNPRAFRMRSGCDTTTPCAQWLIAAIDHDPQFFNKKTHNCASYVQLLVTRSFAARGRYTQIGTQTRNTFIVIFQSHLVHLAKQSPYDTCGI